MRILLVTDAFPPVCGGSGWSSYELARGLRDRGHELVIAQPIVSTDPGRLGSWRGRFRDARHREHAEADRRPEASVGAGATAAALPEYDGFRPLRFSAWAPPVPFLRNYFGNERLYRRFGAWLASLVKERRIDLVHAQHLRSGPAAVAAASEAGVPVVCTVRDYWPVCYWSDLIYSRSAATLCPRCSPAMMTRCLRPHAGVLWPVGIPMIPYMRANLAGKRQALAAADAVIAVSHAMARDLRARAPELAGARIDVIPNPVDLAGLQARAAARGRPLEQPYAVYIGKLAPNKGVMKLVPALVAARFDWPLVVVGDGPERPALEAALTAAGLDARFTGWLPRDEVLGWLHHAEFLVFPSHGPESLSRVLLEASALGVPAAALDTGGTREIVVDEETGLLSQDVEEFGRDIGRLRADADLRERLGRAARRRVETLFETGKVVAQLERLYEDVRRTAGDPRGSRSERGGR